MSPDTTDLSPQNTSPTTDPLLPVSTEPREEEIKEPYACWVLYLTPLEEQIWTYIVLNSQRIDNEVRVGLFKTANDFSAKGWVRKGVLCTPRAYEAAIERFRPLLDPIPGNTANGRKQAYRLRYPLTDFQVAPLSRRQVYESEGILSEEFLTKFRQPFADGSMFDSPEAVRAAVEEVLGDSLTWAGGVLLFGSVSQDDEDKPLQNPDDPLRYGLLRKNDAGHFICAYPGFEPFVLKQSFELPSHIGSLFVGSGGSVTFLNPDEMGCENADGPFIHLLNSCLFDEAGDPVPHDPLLRWHTLPLDALEVEVGRLSAFEALVAQQRETAAALLEDRRGSEQRRMELTKLLDATKQQREAALRALREAEGEERRLAQELKLL